MNILIRDLDINSVKKLDEIARKKGLSRQEFLKNYIETLSVLDTIKENEAKYVDLVNQMYFIVKENTSILTKIREELLLDD